MELIDLLKSEHRRIEQFMDAMLEWAASTAAGDPDGPADCSDVARWLHEFADDHHHGKEEGMLFVAMFDAGMPREMGPIAVMLREHDLGRAAVRELNMCAARGDAWDEATRRQALNAAERFADVLRPHIMKEDQILYHMAEQVIPAEVKRELDEKTKRFETEHAARRQEMQAIFDRLCERWGQA